MQITSTLGASNCGRQTRLCFVACCVCVAVIYASLFHWDLRHHISIFAVTSTEQHHHQQHQPSARMVQVESSGNLTDRLNTFNAFLSSFRKTELERIEASTAHWPRPGGTGAMNVVWGATDDYVQLLSNYSQVTTIVLPWLNTHSSHRDGHGSTWSSLQDSSNLLIQTYYRWTADETLCALIESKGNINARSYDVTYDRKCDRNINDSFRPSSIELLTLNAKPLNMQMYWPNNGTAYPAHFYTHTPPYVTFMHIHRHAIVTELGDVITDGLKLVPLTCSKDTGRSLPITNIERIAFYSELFVIAQYWGKSVFHRMVEIVPRLSLYVQFLQANSHIRILAPEAGGDRLAELMEIIGLHGKSRLVTGLSRASVVYQPTSTGCGFANVHESQVLSQLYRDYIRRTFPGEPRNRLVLIRRSRTRRFAAQKSIEQILQRLATDFNLTYTLFSDNPTPSLKATMTMFHSAVVVVAPHGAGLSNVFFSQPGTYVIETVCNVPHVNMCYQRLAHVLGHHWHGISSRSGCEAVINTDASTIQHHVEQYLRLWKRETSTANGRETRKS